MREQLPQLLEDLSRSHRPDTYGGPRIPGHTILGEIGQGGMSTVYLARQDKLGRHVAIKVAPAWLGGGDRARRMLVHEAHAMARLTHPNIVVIHDIIDVDDTFAIAMEWVDGRTLASLLRALPDRPHEDDMALLRAALGTAPEQRANFADSAHRHFAQLIRDVARAAQTVHDNELLHLDIKPSNVLVRRDGTPLLADFGVTRDISLESTQTRTFAGTPAYSAPEQLRRDDQNIGPHTDVYSLGVTLYEALARHQPLQGMDVASIAKFIESGSMPRLSRRVSISPDLENIVHKAIAPEPEHRYQTAAGFADDLTAFLDHRPVVARPLRAGQRIRRWARNEPWKAGLALTLSVVLPLIAGLGTYLAVQWPSIEAGDVNSRRAEANQLKQEAYQRWLTNQMTTAEAIVALEQAIQLDPDDSSIACLLALTNEEGWDKATETIARHAPEKSFLGMGLFADKVTQMRSFFNAEEVEQLRASESVGDHYLVALDQVFRAHDDHLETSAALAQQYLEEALLMARQDPLLLGLIAWFAVRAEDSDRFESSQRTMRQRWPEDPTALAWAPLAVEPADSERAKLLAREIIEMLPQSPRGYELLAGAQHRSNELEQALTVVEAATTASVEPPVSKTLRLKLRAANGDARATAERAELARTRNDLIAEIHALSEGDPDGCMELVSKIIEMPNPSPRVLAQAYFVAIEKKEFTEELWQRIVALYPDRKRVLSARFLTLIDQRAYAEAAEIGREFVSPKKVIEVVGPWKARCFLFTRDYENLARAGERWQQVGKAPDEACFYQAIGYARLGNYELAAKRIALSLHATSAGKSWYVQALLEDALLRCAPDVPEQLRDHEWAMTRLNEFEQRNPTLKKPHSGPWTRLIRGEVLLANGETERAIKEFQMGLRPRQRREVIAPRDYHARLKDALQRAEAAAAAEQAANKKD